MPIAFIQRTPRREARIAVRWKAAIEKLAEREQRLPPELASVYQRVHADPTAIGSRHALTICDISMNGAFVAGEPLPLLSRVALVFEVPEFRTVESVGWVMWRRKEPCTIIRENGRPLELPPGFGVLFEWLPLEARLEIARRVARDLTS
jgi:hypothetical protein